MRIRMTGHVNMDEGERPKPEEAVGSQEVAGSMEEQGSQERKGRSSLRSTGREERDKRVEKIELEASLRSTRKKESRFMEERKEEKKRENKGKKDDIVIFVNFRKQGLVIGD
jgi:hypothetical protein